MPFGNSKPTPSDTPPRPHLPKQFHQLGPKYSNGGHSPSNHQVLPSDSVLCQGFISLTLHVPEQVVIFSKRWSFLIGVLLACVSVRGHWLRPQEHFLLLARLLVSFLVQTARLLCSLTLHFFKKKKNNLGQGVAFIYIEG